MIFASSTALNFPLSCLNSEIVRSRTCRDRLSLGSSSLCIFRSVNASFLSATLSSIERYSNGSTNSLQYLEASERLRKDRRDSE